MTQQTDDRKTPESVPDGDRKEAGAPAALHARGGRISGGLFTLFAILMMVSLLFTGSCSDAADNETALSPPPTQPKAVRPSPSPPAQPVQPAQSAQPVQPVPQQVEAPKAESPKKPSIPEVRASSYARHVEVENIGIIGISPGALDITGEVLNYGDLTIDEVEISIRYRDAAGKTVFTDQHKLIGELPSPKPLRPGRMMPFDYEINSEYYEKAPELEVEITNLQLRQPQV